MFQIFVRVRTVTVSHGQLRKADFLLVFFEAYLYHRLSVEAMFPAKGREKCSRLPIN